MFNSKKIMKTLVAIMMLLSITLGSAFTTDVHAAGGPNLTVKHTVNGSLVTLAEGATATSEVTIVSDVPAVFYLNGTSVSDGYSTQKKVGGTGSFTVYAVDQAGNMSDTVSFKVLPSVPSRRRKTVLKPSEAGTLKDFSTCPLFTVMADLVFP